MIEGKNIAIRGAGVVGLWQAVTLARRGHRVTVSERSPVPFMHGCSLYAGAMLAPNCEKETAELIVRDLGRRSLALWRAAYPGAPVNGTLVVALQRDRTELDRFARMTEGHRRLSPADLAAVGEFRTSDGLSEAGVRRWTYRYRGVPQLSSRSRGYLGMPEVRITDGQAGVVTYAQSRLDWPFAGEISQVRAFDAPFNAHTLELAREEHSVGELEALTGIRQPTLSQQLGVLRDERLVETRREGKSIRYRITSPQALAVMRVLYEQFCERKKP